LRCAAIDVDVHGLDVHWLDINGFDVDRLHDHDAVARHAATIVVTRWWWWVRKVDNDTPAHIHMRMKIETGVDIYMDVRSYM
jgi:hypothetical protein